MAGRPRSGSEPLPPLLRANDAGKVSDVLIADRLAALNYEAHQAVRDNTVGPRSIVVWTRRPEARHTRPAGGHQFYTGIARDQKSDPIPTIANGLDVQSIAGAILRRALERMADLTIDRSDPGGFLGTYTDELNRLLGNLPSDPDEKLR